MTSRRRVERNPIWGSRRSTGVQEVFKAEIQASSLLLPYSVRNGIQKCLFLLWPSEVVSVSDVFLTFLEYYDLLVGCSVSCAKLRVRVSVLEQRVRSHYAS